MSKIGCTVLLNRETSSLSPHFGKAKWVMITDRETGKSEFEQNFGMNGRAVVDILARHRCSDVIFAEIGPGALSHLKDTGIKAWFGPQGVGAPEVMEKLKRGELSAALAPSPGHGQHQHAGGGCCGSIADHAPCCQGKPESLR